VVRIIKKNQAILVLGAGRDQKYLIKSAKSLGLFVHCVDIQKNPEGSKYADKFYNISSRNIIALKELIDRLKNTQNPICGVITMGSDIPHIVAELSVHAKTPSITMDAAKSAKNKLLMKEKFILGGVATPKFSAVSSYIELKSVLKSYNNSEIVLKPIDQAGSRGVSLTTASSENLKDLYTLASLCSNEEYVLVEEFISGPQISTEHIILKGQIFTPGFADRNYDQLRDFLPQIMENGGWVPSIHLDKKELIEQEILKAANALDLDNCIVKGDVVLKDGIPMVIEIAARLSGGDFSESLVPLGTGVNYVEAALDLCLGREPNIESFIETKHNTIANRYFFAEKGRIKRIKIKSDLTNLVWLEKIEFWIKPGDLIENIQSHGQRSGVFVVSGSDREDVSIKIKHIYDQIEFEYEG